MAYPEPVPPTRSVNDPNPPDDVNMLSAAVTSIDSRLHTAETADTTTDSRLGALEAPSVVAKTTSFSFSTNELNKIVTVSNAAAQNATMPSITASPGQTITVVNIGAGTWTFVATSGNVTSYGSVFSLPSGATATLLNIATNTWKLSGQLT